MKVLVIGSEGFIGGFMIRMLKDKGHSVVGLDVRQAEDGRENNYTFIQGDLMNKDDLRKAMQDAGMVINLAAKHHDFGISREEFFEINEEGTRRITQVMSELGVKKHIFYSSVAVYGDIEECSHEGMPPAPSNDYGESKLAAEHVIEAWVKEDPSREVIFVRPTVVFGPNNFANMYKLISMIDKKKFIPVGKGENIKSVTYVENLVAMTGFVMEGLKPGVEVYNYSDYDHRTSKAIINDIRQYLGKRPYAYYIPLTPILAVAWVVDVLAAITKINFPITANRIKKLNTRTWHGSDKVRQLGFKQEVTITEGLKRMVDWYKHQKSGN